MEVRRSRRQRSQVLPSSDESGTMPEPVHLNLAYRPDDFSMTYLTCERGDKSSFDAQLREAQRRVRMWSGESGLETCTLTGREILARALAKCAFTEDYAAHLDDLKALLSVADDGVCFEYRVAGRAGASYVIAYVAGHHIFSKSEWHFEGVQREYTSGLREPRSSFSCNEPKSEEEEAREREATARVP